MKMWKKVLIIIGIIIFILAIIVLMRFNIYNTINKKYDEMNQKDNYYFYSESSDSIMKYWKKGKVHKMNIQQIKGNGNLTFWENTDTNESYVFVETTKKYSKGNEFLMVKNLPLFGYYVMPQERFGITLMFALNPMCTIYSGKYENKDCYILGVLEEGSAKEWIDKETGLLLYREEDDDNRKIQYSFDIVTDEDIKMPNLSEYELTE